MDADVPHVHLSIALGLRGVTAVGRPAPTATRPPLDDAQIRDTVRLARTGDAEAVESLIRAFRPRIQRFCLARLGRQEVAEDVTQETCLALTAALPRYEDRGVPFTSFVFGIAANKVAMARRSMTRSREVVHAIPDGASREPTPEQQALSEAGLRHLLTPIFELPERHREILLLRVVDQLSADEVAALLGMTAGAVRVAQHRALRTLRRRLGVTGT